MTHLSAPTLAVQNFCVSFRILLMASSRKAMRLLASLKVCFCMERRCIA